MKERRTLAIPDVLRVDTVNTIYRMDLTGIDPRGDVHDFYEIVCVEEGIFSVLVDGVAYEIPKGSLFVYAPNAYHIGNTERANNAVVSIVSFSSRSTAMQWFDNRMLTPTEEELGLISSFFSLSREVMCMSGPGGISLRDGVSAQQLQLVGNRLEGLLLMLYREDCVPAPLHKTRRSYKKARFLMLSSYLKERLGKKITLVDMAEVLSCSVSAVKALCREFCASGPNDYLISLRIGRARELIREGEMSFTEIAEMVGFGTLHYFSRVFKARTGQTPTEYAKSF